MNSELIQSGNIEWTIIKNGNQIRVILNDTESANLPIDVFRNEKEAIETAKYNVINNVIAELGITTFGLKNGVHRPLDEPSKKLLSLT